MKANQKKPTTAQQNVQKEKGTNFYTDKSKLARRKLLNSGKIQRDRDGKFVSQLYQERKQFVARVEPNRKWFENTRTISQKEIQELKEVQLKSGEYLLRELPKIFHTTAAPMAIKPDYKSKKRPTLSFTSIDEMAQNSVKKLEDYDGDADVKAIQAMQGPKIDANRMFMKGQSKRIWSELYKVIDSSDVILHVLDSRDPMGTRCPNVLKYLKEEKRHKNIVYVLNKCDLVPVWVTQKWKTILEKEYPTIAFHANLKNPFGKSSLINLLRQFSKLHSDKKQISVGMVGYPNVGKSSLINTLKEKKVCTVAPIPGETKHWQYIALMKRIFLIDCPGVVYSTNDTETDIILKGVVRVENIEETEDYVKTVLERCRPEYLQRTYGVKGWTDHLHFLKLVAEKYGKLLKGGEPDLNTVSKMVLNDWIRGKIPFYTAPAESPLEDGNNDTQVEQKMGKIRISADFTVEDLKGPETISKESEISIVDEQPEEDEEEELLIDENETWEDVFGQEDESITIKSLSESEFTDSEIEELAPKKSLKRGPNHNQEQQEQVGKKKRMTTNKKKATNFYTFANVKNRNRNKKEK